MSEKIKNERIHWLRENFVDGKITRREFMAKMAVLGVATALPFTLNEKTAEAATPKKGGVLKLAWGMAPQRKAMIQQHWQVAFRR